MLCQYLGVLCPKLNDTNAIFNTSNTIYSTTVRVTCKPGYAFDPMNFSNNTVNTVCTQYGTWSEVPDLCQSMHVFK